MAQTYITPVANPKNPYALSKTLLLIVGAIVAVIIGVMFLVFSSSNNPTADMDRLNARIAIMQEVINLGKKNTTSPDIKKVVTDASILLIGDASSLETAAGSLGANGRNKEIIASEADTETLEKLATAAINGQFDETYTPILQAKLESTIELLQAVKGKTKDKTYQTAAEKTYTDLSIILEATKKLTAS